MKFLKLVLYLSVAQSFLSCNTDKFSMVATKVVLSDFETTTDLWTGAMAEYSVKQNPTDTNLVKVARANLPSGLDTLRYGLTLNATNQSANTFTYLRKEITGLNKGHTYNISFDIRLGTNFTKTSAIAASTYLKAGAASVKPTTDSTTYAFNLDKGKGSVDGQSMVVLGDISNDLGRAVYASVERNTNGKTVQVRANEQGIIWLCVGIDSGYKGNIFLYFDRITATISEISNN